MTNEELAIQAKSGDPKVIEALWLQIKAFIAQMARRYYTLYESKCVSFGIELDDLIQVGYFAMLNAIGYYEQDSEYKFLTYMNKPLFTQFQKLTNSLNDSVMSEEAARKKNNLTNSTSLDAVLADSENGSTLGDIIPDPNAAILMEQIDNADYIECLHSDLDSAMAKIPERRAKYMHEVNGIRFFAMGADYVPEDNILSRMNEERTRTLLQHCYDCNFNAIRIWGGGVYPADYFFDACDELGLVVFFDMMFACSSIVIDDHMMDSLRMEITQNLTRLRHHPSIVLISGNNEIELWATVHPEPYTRYLDLFEDMIPDVISKVCPEIPYVPSSPSSVGHFLDPQNEHFGDCHYYDVWTGKPISEYRNCFFRYLSEFGFESYPCEKTVNAYTLPEDRNVFSRIMEIHQRCPSGNKFLMQYISDYYKYPTSLGIFLYTTQLLQADAIRYCIEHLRRNRGRCMGALYWQLNDIWPVASWSSIDSFGRYKALQYYAKRFFAPIMISCREVGIQDSRFYITTERMYDYKTTAQLSVNNDTLQEITGIAAWELRNANGDILKHGQSEVTIPPMSVVTLEDMDFCKTDVYHNYLSYSFATNGSIVSSGTVLFAPPKHFEFCNPNLHCKIHGNELTVYADCYAKSVEIDSLDSDFLLSDNFFDMNPGSRTVNILSGSPKTVRLRSIYDIR